jgi:hypothetical protein
MDTDEHGFQIAKYANRIQDLFQPFLSTIALATVEAFSLPCRAVALAKARRIQHLLPLLVPQGQFQKHLHTLANLAKPLHKQDFRDGL